MQLEKNNHLPTWKAILDAIVFASDVPIPSSEVLHLLNKELDSPVSKDEFYLGLNQIKLFYNQAFFGFGLFDTGEGLQFLTKNEHFSILNLLLQQQSKKRLSQVAIETLAIIAYKQPITKPEIEAIRGVNCDYVLNKLLESELISIKGKSNLPGRPIIYGTSGSFLDYFGISSLSELPKLEDLKVIE